MVAKVVEGRGLALWGRPGGRRRVSRFAWSASLCGRAWVAAGRRAQALVARGNYTYLSGHSLLLLGSLPVRSRLRRRRERRQRQQRQPRRQSDGEGFGPEFRTLRGGAQSKQEKLLAGLAALISSCQEEEEQEAPRRPPSDV